MARKDIDRSQDRVYILNNTAVMYTISQNMWAHCDLSGNSWKKVIELLLN
jgi:hypothetical protein